MYYVLFSVHELSDDETRPDAHSVTTEVETAEGNYTVDDSNYNECVTSMRNLCPAITVLGEAIGFGAVSPPT